MSLGYTGVTTETISLLQLAEGTISQVRVRNSGASSITVKMCLKGYDGKAAEDATNLEGKEIATEGWVYVRKTGETAWNQIKEPSVFPDSWDDLTDGCFIFTIAGLSYQDIDVKVVVPDDPESTGITHFSISMSAY